MIRILILTAFSLSLFSTAQTTKLVNLDFETPGGYTTSIPEFTDYLESVNQSGRDHFLRTNGDNIRAEIFTNKQGSFYFAARDIDGEGAELPVTLRIENINISGYSNLEFRIHIAEDDLTLGEEHHWDSTDYVHINYDLDNSNSDTNLLWIEGTGSNTAPQIDSDFDQVGDSTEITDKFEQFKRDISGTGELLDIIIVFRLNSKQEDIAIDNIEIWGDLDPPSGSIVTWDGDAWDNVSGPNLSTPVVLNADFDTEINGNFNGYSLTLNGASLNISDYTLVKIQNDITIDSESDIAISSKGTLTQRNDFSTITNEGSNSLTKTTALVNNWYEYTMWSSPVSNETIGNGLSQSHTQRVYKFEAKNFLDATKETNNDNDTVTGQDDVDDNGDDWAFVNGATTMIPGVGYIAPQKSNASIDEGGSHFNNTFNGTFNNGLISIPIYRDDSELNDYNWNLIGNPYPSAIDVDQFLIGNSNLDYAVYLWSQDTPPSSSANGNTNLNFSNDDYAIINAMGELAGGDGVKPSRYIPSGQGFFVSMANPPIPATNDVNNVSSSTVVFSNSMRVANTFANSQFFKNSRLKTHSNNAIDKIWLNLTSDNGVFNQILIGYSNQATNSDDGSLFDINKYPTAGAAIYSIIEGSHKMYAIQGRSKTDLKTSTSLPIGFTTTIEVPTIYKLSVQDFEGEFLNNHVIYLNDKLENKTHSLSISEYAFSSTTGAFSERFEISFVTKTLSKNHLSKEKQNIQIIKLKDDSIRITSNSTYRIKDIKLFDLMGRCLYEESCDSISRVVPIKSLIKDLLIIKVEISNGSIITKKILGL